MADDDKDDGGYTSAGKPSDTKAADVAKQEGRPAPLPPAPEVGGKNG